MVNVIYAEKKRNENQYASVNDLILNPPYINYEPTSSENEAAVKKNTPVNNRTDNNPREERAERKNGEWDRVGRYVPLMDQFDQVGKIEDEKPERQLNNVGGDSRESGNLSIVVAAGYNIDAIISNLEQLERLAKYYQQRIGSSTSINELILHYIRRSRYNTGNWPVVAGDIDSSFIAFVNSHISQFSGYFHDNILFFDPLTGEDVDFVHLIATLNGLIYETRWNDAGISSLVGEAHINNLAGWAGDLQTLVMEVIETTNNSNNYDVLYQAAIDLMGGEAAVSSFPMMDLLADTDAWNIYNRLGTMSLPDAFREYYLNGGSKTRYADFTGNRSKEQIRRLSGRYTDNWFIWPVKWPLLRNVDVTRIQSSAVRDAFTDFIWERVLEERNRPSMPKQMMEEKGIYGTTANIKWEDLSNVPLPSLEDVAKWRDVLRVSSQMMTGDDVKELQTVLMYFGSTIEVDGVFGPQTEKAVKDFQKDNNLASDGVVGYKTRQVLQEFLAQDAINNGAAVFSIEVKRKEETEDTTLGELYVQGEKIGYTLELAWRGNQTDISRIEPGEYYAFMRSDSRIELINVSGRNYIQIHTGNVYKDIKGCILPGKSHRLVRESDTSLLNRHGKDIIDTQGVFDSKLSFADIINRYREEGGIIKITVRDDFGV